jgi:hypothetical protein
MFLREKSSEEATTENVFTIRSITNESSVLTSQNGAKHLLIPTSVSALNQKDHRTQPNVPSSIEIHNRNFATDEVN